MLAVYSFYRKQRQSMVSDFSGGPVYGEIGSSLLSKGEFWQFEVERHPTCHALEGQLDINVGILQKYMQ
jgi:hypothetical protein